MPDNQKPPLGHPHTTDWFFNLLGLYDRQSRPIASYYDDTAGNESDFASARAEQYQQLFTLGIDRRKKYEIFDEMDTYGLVSAILDVYSEEATQRDYDKGVSVWVESKAAHMVEAGQACLHNCQVEDKLPAIVRRYCKYGDAFQRLIYATEKGVLNWKFAKTLDVTRHEDKYGRLVGFSEQNKTFRGGKRTVSWPWDYVHMRLLGKDEESGYGTSLLQGMFQTWRRMTLTEEAVLMYRLRRMPDRNLIQVNVGSMEEHAAMAYVNAFRKKLRKHEMVDPASPNYRKQYNPITPLEDIFLPLVEGREHRVETLSGAGNVGEVFDLDHFRDAFFGSAKVPKAYFGFEGDVNAKATLAQQDVRFARSAKRIQRVALYGIRQLLDIHFTLLQPSEGEKKNRYDFRNKENAYIVQMSPISFLDEFSRLELVQLRNTILEAMSGQAATLQLDPRIWATYLLINYAKLPEDLVLKLIKKTPDSVAPPVVGGGPGFEALSALRKDQVLDNNFKAGQGYFQLNEAEQRMIGKLVHDSPKLRRSISIFAELGQEEGVTLEAGMRQTDASLVPPILVGKATLEDTIEDTLAAKDLLEDMRELQAGKLKS
jgi:hypothetical protein